MFVFSALGHNENYKLEKRKENTEILMYILRAQYLKEQYGVISFDAPLQANEDSNTLGDILQSDKDSEDFSATYDIIERWILHLKKRVSTERSDVQRSTWNVFTTIMISAWCDNAYCWKLMAEISGKHSELSAEVVEKAKVRLESLQEKPTDKLMAEIIGIPSTKYSKYRKDLEAIFRLD